MINLSCLVERVVWSHKLRSLAEQSIKEAKNTIRRRGLSCHAFRDNGVSLHLFALAYTRSNTMSSPVLRDDLARKWYATKRKLPYS